MAILVLCLVLLLAMTTLSDANYCVCNSGLSDSVLQKSIDYACGNGADCSAIQQNGVCYNPNTVRDHCSYAVNSYYQRKNQINGSCDFSSTATIVQNAPSAASGCVYQSSPSGGGNTTSPPTNPTTPPTNPATAGPPPPPNTGGIPTPTPPGVLVPGSMVPPGGSTDGGFVNTGNRHKSAILFQTGTFMLVLFLMFPRILI